MLTAYRVAGLGPSPESADTGPGAPCRKSSLSLSFSFCPSLLFLRFLSCVVFVIVRVLVYVRSGTSTQEGRLRNFSLNSLKTRIDHGHLDRIKNIQMKWRNNEPKLFRFFAMQAFQTVNLVPFESVGTTKKGDLRSITPCKPRNPETPTLKP